MSAGRCVVIAGVLVALGAALLGAPGPSPQGLAAGCFPGRPHAAGTTVATIETAQGTREYRLYVPASYTGADRVPLIFGFHGLGSDALGQELYSGLSAWLDVWPTPAIAVYPEGTTNPLGAQYWNIGQILPYPDDVGFVNQLLDYLESALCIDSDRVYSSGMSNGAMMSVRLACSVSSRFAAVAPIAGAYYPPLLTEQPAEVCPDTRAVPMIAFHGTADTIVPYYGGPGAIGGTFRLPQDNATPDDDVMQSWAAHNGCASGRSETVLTAEVRLIEYTGCTDGALMQHYAVDGGGHTWPGSFDVPGLGYTTHDINATELMLEFFKAHPMPAAPPEPDSDGDTVPDISDPDNDNDGCLDANEAGLDETAGGLRDSKNPHDYFNPSGDGQNRVDDVLLVLNQYFMDDDDANPGLPPYAPGYNPQTDRTLLGPDAWNLGPPNGEQRVDDVVNILNQYFHDCG